MKRKWKIGILIGVVVLLSGLAITLLVLEPWRTPILTEERKEQLIAAWKAPDPLYADELTDELRLKMMQLVIGSELNMNPNKPGAGDRVFEDAQLYFLGNYSGYTAIFSEGYQFAVWTETIGNEVFRAPNVSNIYLYRDGEWIALKEAYAEGLISDSKLFKLAARYYRFQAGASGVIHEERYRDVEQSKSEMITEEQKEMLRYELFYIKSKEAGLDIDNPGEGARIFAGDYDVAYYYLGTYNGNHAILNQSYSETPETQCIGEEYFCNLYTSWIALYRNDSDSELDKAYNADWISAEDLFTLAKRYYQFQIENAEDPETIRQQYGEYAARYE